MLLSTMKLDHRMYKNTEHLYFEFKISYHFIKIVGCFPLFINIKFVLFDVI